MKNNRVFRKFIERLPASLLLLSAVGCGELNGGAHSVVTVKYRPASNSASAEAVPSGEQESTQPAVGEVAGVGSLKGRIEFVGEYQPLPPLFAKGGASKDPSVCGLESIPNESVLVKDGGLANVFIYLEKAPKGGVSAASTNPIIFDQKICVFLPHAMIVRTKQVVKILNADAAAHNTHTYPKKNSGFNSVVQPNDREGVEMIYSQPEKEPLSVGCDIHPWMIAYHLPLDHAYGAVSAADGTFEIKDLPAGKHEFKIWHEAGKMIEKSYPVVIKPGDNEVAIKIPASKLGR